MTDHIGPFGPESRTAATEVLHEQTNICVGADTCDSRTVADEVLSAAVSALDLEAQAEIGGHAIVEAKRKRRRTSTYGIERELAAAVIADIFPTEGEAEQ